MRVSSGILYHITYSVNIVILPALGKHMDERWGLFFIPNGLVYDEQYGSFTSRTC